MTAPDISTVLARVEVSLTLGVGDSLTLKGVGHLFAVVVSLCYLYTTHSVV